VERSKHIISSFLVLVNSLAGCVVSGEKNKLGVFDGHDNTTIGDSDVKACVELYNLFFLSPLKYCALDSLQKVQVNYKVTCSLFKPITTSIHVRIRLFMHFLKVMVKSHLLQKLLLSSHVLV